MAEGNDTRSERYELATCPLYDSGTCRSCSLLGTPSGSRIGAKSKAVLDVLQEAGVQPQAVEPMLLPSTPWGSRAKVKMVVGGSLEDPLIGIVGPDLQCIELASCPLPPAPVQLLLEHVRRAIKDFSLVPYDIQARRGELKALIVMSNADCSKGILRFVLRSTEAVPRIKKSLPGLAQAHPWIKVVSCNIQPLPAAILEGEQEILLTENDQIEAQYGPVTLLFSPQSFMQVTPEVAGALYAKAKQWGAEIKPRRLLDLFCGVGGFSLSLAPACESVTGIELSTMATESAALAARRMGLADKTRFIAGDAVSALRGLGQASFDTVVVNPPRRGLSPELLKLVGELNPSWVLYSSCSPQTFARDVAAWQGKLELVRVALFDMFPLTEHCELLGLLRRAA